MKLKIFDVVDLYDGNKATILENNKGLYKAEIVDSKGNNQGIVDITEKDIKSIIISK